MKRKRSSSTTRTAVGHNPLEGEQLLLDALYGQRRTMPAARAQPPVEAAASNKKPKPEHYKVVSISLYNEDIERLDRMVIELKRRGHHKANKSQLIRQALAQIDLDQVGKEA
jgi:hypothetical protein